MGEFDIIKEIFTNYSTGENIALSIGDDGAILNNQENYQTIISTDMLVEGTHFFPDVDANLLGHKALAVNLSDMAAMGARPIAFTLAISMPADKAKNIIWLKSFAKGMFDLARKYKCPLIGGDTTRGNLNICITIFASVDKNKALLRSGAKINDDIYISGNIGLANLALQYIQGKIKLPDNIFQKLRQFLEKPIPRITLGQNLINIANSAIDISDGLSGDLSHILKASKVGAKINYPALLNKLTSFDNLGKYISPQTISKAIMSGGDDYELLFTAPKSKRDDVLKAARLAENEVFIIGEIVDKNAGDNFEISSFNHFC